MMGSTVVCTASHPVDLDDGRSLPPGVTAEDVDLELGTNQQLVDDGLLTVLGGEAKAPRKTTHGHQQDEGGSS